MSFTAGEFGAVVFEEVPRWPTDALRRGKRPKAVPTPALPIEKIPPETQERHQDEKE